MEEKSATALSLPENYSTQRRSSIERRVQQTTEYLAGRHNILILMHNDPDPDAIASAYALEKLLHILAPAVNITLAHGGMIGRAENRTMATLFTSHQVHIPTNLAAEQINAYDGVMLVDTQPVAGNHLLWRTDYSLEDILLALDHHPPKRSQIRAKVHDVRPDVGASSTILCEYLAVTAVPVDARLATALFYGIKSDTLGLSRHTSDLDIWAYSILRNRLDTDLLNRIEHVRVPRTYYRGISEALANTTLYSFIVRSAANDEHDANGKDDLNETENANSVTNGEGAPHKLHFGELSAAYMGYAAISEASSYFSDDMLEEAEGSPAESIGYVAISLLFDMQRTDMAAEVADLLMRMEDVFWAICLGIYEDWIVISVRTNEAAGGKAGRLVRSVAGRNGSAGGHYTMAGGRIHLPDKTPAERVAELHGLVPRFLNELEAGDSMGVSLLDLE